MTLQWNPPRARFAAFATLLACTLVAACNGGDGPVGGVAVDAVLVSAPGASVVRGASLALSAQARDAGGRVMGGRRFTWASSDTALARVDSAGQVTGRAMGAVTITATETVSGRSGVLQLTVVAPPAARLAIAPRFATVEAGGTTQLQATAHGTDGLIIPAPPVDWSVAQTATATINASGVVTGVAPGVTTIRAGLDQARDTAWLAVLGPASLLSTVFVEGTVKPDVSPGATVTVPVRLDLSRVSSDGDLGQVRFILRYDPAVLVYQSAEAQIAGSASFQLPAPGTVGFAFTGTGPQGAAPLTLATLTFRVADGAPVGAQSIVTLMYTAVPTSTGGQPYSPPVTVWGRLRVVAS